MMAVQASEKRMRDMIITKETDYALRILRVLLDGEKHSVAEMSETELIPNQLPTRSCASSPPAIWCG